MTPAHIFIIMLEDLLRGQEKSQLVLITDTSKNNGRNLLLNWLESMLGRCEKLVLLCFERPPMFFKNWLQPGLAQKLICIDGNGDTDEDGEPSYGLEKTMEAVLQTKGTPTCVVIDSISLPMLMRPPPVTCSYLHKMTTVGHVVQVATLVHRDLTDQHACGQLEHIATSVVDLLPSTLGSSQVCHVRHCRSTGKVFKTRECFELDDSFHIQKISALKTAQEKHNVPAPLPQEPDPTASLDLSFKLQLTDSEREARSQVVLPYLKDGSTEESTSRIIYEADDADDFDEEDPDDDLNI